MGNLLKLEVDITRPVLELKGASLLEKYEEIMENLDDLIEKKKVEK